MMLLEHTFHLHRTLNAQINADDSGSANSADDFYQCVKVNNNIRVEHGFSARRLIHFLQRKVIEHGDDIVNEGAIVAKQNVLLSSAATAANTKGKNAQQQGIIVRSDTNENDIEAPQTLRQLFYDELQLSVDNLTVDDVLFRSRQHQR